MKLFSKEEKAAIKALINLYIVKGNISDERDMHDGHYKYRSGICALIKT